MAPTPHVDDNPVPSTVYRYTYEAYSLVGYPISNRGYIFPHYVLYTPRHVKT